MLSEKETTKLSKFLSLVLRHKPETIDLQLDENGWADVSVLLEKMNRSGANITPEILDYIVATNAKKRFAYNDDKTMIRANQGHSIEVDLQLTPALPPAVLYHGTGEQSVASILHTGLEKRNRQHVHLSPDVETAITVGKRHGKPVVLKVDTLEMLEAGFKFYLSENGVWLTEVIPAKYLSLA